MKYSALVIIVVSLFACNTKKNTIKETVTVTTTESVKYSVDSSTKITAKIDDVATILARKQVPILCYHHINDQKPGDYRVPPANFAAQMQALSDSGYTSILPDELYNYLAYGKALPAKPVMLTFDDTDEEQFTVGNAEMKKHHFKGVFFIMNISIGRPRYMNKEQMKQLSDEGNVIAAHTWDHHMVTKYTAADWVKQLDEAKQKLITITGKPVVYFAYPFGLWNKAATVELPLHGIKMAFQLSDKMDAEQPLYTVRRMLVPGSWSTNSMFKFMKGTFRL